MGGLVLPAVFLPPLAATGSGAALAFTGSTFRRACSSATFSAGFSATFVGLLADAGTDPGGFPFCPWPRPARERVPASALGTHLGSATTLVALAGGAGGATSAAFLALAGSATGGYCSRDWAATFRSACQPEPACLAADGPREPAVGQGVST